MMLSSPTQQHSGDGQQHRAACSAPVPCGREGGDAAPLLVPRVPRAVPAMGVSALAQRWPPHPPDLQARCSGGRLWGNRWSPGRSSSRTHQKPSLGGWLQPEVPCGARIHLHCKSIEICFGFFVVFFFFFPPLERHFCAMGLFVRLVPPPLLPSMASDAASWDPGGWLCSVFCWMLSVAANPAAANGGRCFPPCWRGINIPWG